MIYHHRVIFGDTDQMGVVYYANYFRYFEAARAEYWRSIGHSYKDLEEWNIVMPVVDAQCRYHKPAYYEDVLAIDIVVSQLKGASVQFSYEVRRDSAVLASGYTVHAVCIATGDREGRVTRIPQAMVALIRAAEHG